MKIFFNFKASSLVNLEFQVVRADKTEIETGKDIYLRRSNNLEETINALQNNSKVTIKKYKKCIQEREDDGKLVPSEKEGEFPPLGILIADEHTAILSYNISILAVEPVPLEGHITTDSEQVKAIRVFSDAYYKMYTGNPSATKN